MQYYIKIRERYRERQERKIVWEKERCEKEGEQEEGSSPLHWGPLMEPNGGAGVRGRGNVWPGTT